MSFSHTTHTKFSDPKSFEPIVGGWSLEPHPMSEAISGFVFHLGSEECQNEFDPGIHLVDLRARGVCDILSRVCTGDDGLPERKLAGVCRDFALLAVSSFRCRGIPARLRVGFADYFKDGFWEDHWLCEYYMNGRWRLLDVEVAADTSISSIRFDPADVPLNRFLFASDAWLQIEAGKVSSGIFGVSRLNLCGEWFVAASVFRDAAALCGIELKPWDYWGSNAHFEIGSREASAECRKAAGQLARKITESARLETDQSLVNFAEWLPQDFVTSFPEGDPERVMLI
ncbi:MAG: transglutaminase domain-containing protein [Pseudomonadota bacterium]